MGGQVPAHLVKLYTIKSPLSSSNKQACMNIVIGFPCASRRILVLPFVLLHFAASLVYPSQWKPTPSPLGVAIRVRVSGSCRVKS